MADFTGSSPHASNEPLIDYADERYIEPRLLEAHRERRLELLPFCEHGPLVVVAAGQRVGVVDRDVADLVYAMWQAGIGTFHACADIYDTPDDPSVMIDFSGIGDAELLLSLACRRDDQPGGLWDNATGSNLLMHDSRGQVDKSKVKTAHELRWDWTLTPKIHHRRVGWAVSVTFTKADAVEVALRLHAANL